MVTFLVKDIVISNLDKTNDVFHNSLHLISSNDNVLVKGIVYF